MKTNIITLKRLKKDGTLDASVSERIAEMLRAGKPVVAPVDFMYGFLSKDRRTVRELVKRRGEVRSSESVCIISSFKMLDNVASIGKFEFDFLHRIWPGEITVVMKSAVKKDRSVMVRMPRSHYTQDIIERTGIPLFYVPLVDSRNASVYRRKDIVSSLDGKIDLMLIIDELCREHTPPSIIDISGGSLEILSEGRVSAEEIKSLYFLGKDDQAL